jgi:hypothetical protein
LLFINSLALKVFSIDEITAENELNKLSSIKNCMNASYPYSFTPLSKSPVIGLSNNFYFSDNKLNLERLNPSVTKSSDTSKTSEK